jgi:hypothetical protein
MNTCKEEVSLLNSQPSNQPNIVDIHGNEESLVLPEPELLAIASGVFDREGQVLTRYSTAIRLLSTLSTQYWQEGVLNDEPVKKIISAVLKVYDKDFLCRFYFHVYRINRNLDRVRDSFLYYKNAALLDATGITLVHYHGFYPESILMEYPGWFDNNVPAIYPERYGLYYGGDYYGERDRLIDWDTI